MFDLAEIVKQKVVDYGRIPLDGGFVGEGEFDVSIIIPARGRERFMPSVINSLQSVDTKEWKVAITIVEHSASSSFLKYRYEQNIGAVHIKCEAHEPFNKCLCMNTGVLHEKAHKAKYYLFHDSDLLVNSGFIINIFENIKKKNGLATQTFNGRRVLRCDERVTEELITGKLFSEHLFHGGDGIVDTKQIGAPGGSIFIHRDLFFKVGGFDAELWHSYSPEDLFFWDKMSLYATVGSCDDPINEVYHLDHPLQQHMNPDFKTMSLMYKIWTTLPLKEKKAFCELKSKLIEKWR